jgi:hypothetical protein
MEKTLISEFNLHTIKKQKFRDVKVEVVNLKTYLS